MDARIAPLLDILKLNTRLFLNCLDGVDDETAQTRPGDRVNNMTFIALHLVDARCYLAQYVGLEHENPYKHLEDVASIEEMQDFPALAELRAAWSDVSERLAARFPALSDAVLGANQRGSFQSMTERCSAVSRSCSSTNHSASVSSRSYASISVSAP